MRLRHELRNSVSSRLIRSWLILGASAFFASIVLLMSMIWIEHANQKSRALDDLRSKAGIIARRVSAELIVGERGTLAPVIESLKQELNIDKIVILPPDESCDSDHSSPTCKATITHASTWVTEKIPQLPFPRLILVTREQSLISEALPFSGLLVATLTLGGLLIGGIILQWSAIQKHLLRPINSLIETGGKCADSEHWPVELQKIEQKLYRLLDERDRATSETHRLKTEAMVADLSRRILHDLKSPLGTLSLMIETDLKEVPIETKDNIRRVLGRIRAIVDTNLKEYSTHALSRKTEAPAPTPSPASPASVVGGALRSILEEERSKAAVRGVDFIESISKESYLTFARISFSELCRVFSNLLSNAVDAAEKGQKKVVIEASLEGTATRVTIRDFGTGFDPEVLKKLNAGMPTTTKSKGNGLGFMGAKSLLEQASGTLKVHSFPNGTLVTLIIPNAPTPPWFYDITRLPAQSALALDDDSTIGRKFSENVPGLRVNLVQTEEEFLALTKQSPHDVYFIDYDFGGSRTGLDLIIEENLQAKAVLVSGKIVFDQKLRASAEAKGVRMFPKESLA